MTPRTSSGKGYNGRGAESAPLSVLESSFKDLSNGVHFLALENRYLSTLENPENANRW